MIELSLAMIIFLSSLGISIVLSTLILVGADVSDEADVEISENSVLSFLGFGKVPVLIVLLVLFGLYGILGILITTLTPISSIPLGMLLEIIVPLLLTVIISKRILAIVAKIFPDTETYISDLVDFISKTAIVTIPAKQGNIGEAKVVDDKQQTHYIRVKFNKIVSVGDAVILSSYDENKRLFETI